LQSSFSHDHCARDRQRCHACRGAEARRVTRDRYAADIAAEAPDVETGLVLVPPRRRWKGAGGARWSQSQHRQQPQVGLSWPSQHFALWPSQPQTPPWCEQHPGFSGAGAGLGAGTLPVKVHSSTPNNRPANSVPLNTIGPPPTIQDTVVQAAMGNGEADVRWATAAQGKRPRTPKASHSWKRLVG
jgi:hypothetical protein